MTRYRDLFLIISNDKQYQDAINLRRDKVESQTKKVATTRNDISRALSPVHVENRSDVAVVRNTIEQYGSNVSHKTSSIMVHQGRVGILPRERG